MLTTPADLRRFFDVTPRGVLHVGAHMGEERQWYASSGFGSVILVEAQSELIDYLREFVARPGDLVLEACVWSETGVEINLNIASNGQSTSVFDLGTHSTWYPKVSNVAQHKVRSQRLDECLPELPHFDFINLDIQGAELEALIGLGEMLNPVKWVYVEVNREQLYKGIPLVGEMDTWLEARGFQRVWTVWTEYQWGDALYVRSRDKGVQFKLWVARRSLALWFWQRFAVPRKRIRRMFRKLLELVGSVLRKSSGR